MKEFNEGEPGTGGEHFFATGLLELDAQHQYFYGLVINATRHGVQLSQGAVQALVLEVTRYAQCHFAYEETMMRVYGFPDAERHEEEHRNMMLALRRASDGSHLDVGRVKLHLLKWLNTHVPLDDAPLAAFVLKSRPQFK